MYEYTPVTTLHCTGHTWHKAWLVSKLVRFVNRLLVTNVLAGILGGPVQNFRIRAGLTAQHSSIFV